MEKEVPPIFSISFQGIKNGLQRDFQIFHIQLQANNKIEARALLYKDFKMISNLTIERL